jgi:hypothetical protein
VETRFQGNVRDVESKVHTLEERFNKAVESIHISTCDEFVVLSCVVVLLCCCMIRLSPSDDREVHVCRVGLSQFDETWKGISKALVRIEHSVEQVNRNERDFESQIQGA